jgi:hypothetical protein
MAGFPPRIRGFSPRRVSQLRCCARIVLTRDLGDRDEERELARFANLADAIEYGQRLVEKSLALHYQRGLTGKELYRRYRETGRDVLVDAALEAPLFHGWEYAKKRAIQICGTW